MIFRIYDSKRMDMYIQTIRQNQLARFRNVSWHVYIIYLFIPCRCRRGYIFTRYCRTLSNVSQIIWTGFFSIVNICITNTRNGSIFDNDTGRKWRVINACLYVQTHIYHKSHAAISRFDNTRYFIQHSSDLRQNISHSLNSENKPRSSP